MPSSSRRPRLWQTTRSPGWSTPGGNVRAVPPIIRPVRRGSRCARKDRARPSRRISSICGVQQVDVRVRTARPASVPTIVMSKWDDRPPMQTNGTGSVMSAGFAASVAHARSGEGTSPPAGAHERCQTARPTFGLSARMVSWVAGPRSPPPHPTRNAVAAMTQAAKPTCTRPRYDASYLSVTSSLGRSNLPQSGESAGLGTASRRRSRIHSGGRLSDIATTEPTHESPAPSPS